MRRGRASLWLGATTALLAGCGALVDFSGLSGSCRGPCPDAGDAGGGEEGGDPVDTGVDGTEPDVRDARAEGDTSLPPCPGTAGPVGVRIPLDDGGSYCVDETEITNLQYKQFLAATVDGGLAPGAGVTPLAECAWNTDLRPGSPAWPPASGDDAFPVTHVDWCDAWTYCKWAKKRLCGAIGGRSASLSTPIAKSSDQWYRACRGAADTTYPYGNAYDGAACNGVDRGSGGKPLSTSESGRCVGGYGSLRDMSGNLWEWIDACDGASGAANLCRKMGGAFNSPQNELTCGFASTEPRDAHLSNVGFRCCSDP